MADIMKATDSENKPPTPPMTQTIAETAQTVQMTIDTASGTQTAPVLPTVEGYYVEYVWPDQGDGR